MAAGEQPSTVILPLAGGTAEVVPSWRPIRS
jgi:hypothetical protein